MPETSPLKLPYSGTGDSPHGPNQLKSLAEAAEDALLGVHAVYRTLLTADGTCNSDELSGTYLLGAAHVHPSGAPVAASSFQRPALVGIDDADFLVANLATKLRVRCQVVVNGTKPTITFTFGLYPVTSSGAADQLTYTAGTVVSGSTKAVAEPAASTVASSVGADFAVPADGAYALGVVLSGNLTNNSAVDVHAQLQVRNV